MSLLRNAGVLTLAIVWMVSAAGCKKKNGSKDTDPEDDTSFLEEGTDANAAESDSQVLTSSLVASSPAGTLGLASIDLSGGDLGPRNIGDGAKAIFIPRNCLTVSHDATSQTVTYVFNRCAGPNGLRTVTGTIKAHYESTPNHLHLDLTADELAVNDATLDWAATADITSSDANRTMTWKATLSGTSAGGRTLARSTDYTVSWTLGEACFALSGTSTGEITKPNRTDGREIRTEVSNFRRCRRSCPDAGGKISVTNVSKNKKVELLYDGTNRATFVDPNGKQSTITLLCRL